MTDNYYDQHAKEFCENTIRINMSELYQYFIPHLHDGANILDAGCGSGRDTLYFLQQNFSVDAFDASEKLVALAKKHTQHPINHDTFLSFHSLPNNYDGIWACASLLHVPFNELYLTFKQLIKYLKEGGVMYCSFKYATDKVETEINQRKFTNMNEILFQQVIRCLPLVVDKLWITEDLRVNRMNEKWFNVVLKKVS
ncbi:class I SAM-dependent methyltransferase [Aliivibrio fischeri]|uniref:class I SAM-dependent methyltransferase n=1 Tax=Aliivibrio fischeri TaxID=668 RepID=UPI0007C45EAC|nr:class I SAM-dependent methyltransferase [Aliivibrio fischeri]